jgi:DNA mismatch repair ATPase MutS
MSIPNSGAPAAAPTATPAASPATASATPATASEATESEVIEGEELLEEEGQEPTPAEKKAEEKKRLKKLKLKVDGQEIEEELPFEVDEEHADWIKKQLQLAKGFQKKAQYASQIEKEATELIELLRKDPLRVLSDPAIGHDVKKLMAEYIESEIEQSKKTPEQIEREKMEQELKSLKEEREREKQDNQKRELERLQQQEYERYDMLMTQALEKHPDLPKSPYVVKKMAEYMLLALENDVEASPEDVIPLVREEIKEDLKQMFAVLPEDVVEQLVGKETITKIRRKYVKKAQTTPPTPVKNIPETGKKTEEKKDGDKKMTFKEYFKI